MLSKIFLPILILALVVTVSAAPKAHKCTKQGRGHTTKDERCCVWFDVLDDLQKQVFERECGDEAHEAIRLTFHDAIGISPTLGGGGADGSIMAHWDIEGAEPANGGLDEIIELYRSIAIKRRVAFGDFVQFAGAVGLANCNGAPRLEFMAGRVNSSVPAPTGLISSPADTVDAILARMGDAGLSTDDVVALMASHSVGAQKNLDMTIQGAPLDSTPSAFDAQYFAEVLLKGKEFPGNGSHFGEVESPYPGEFRIASDALLARDPRTACLWQSFIGNHDLMMARFRAAMSKMSLLGQNKRKLYDCSDVIQTPPPLAHRVPILPAGVSRRDIEASCKSKPFPPLRVAPGPMTSIIPVPP